MNQHHPTLLRRFPLIVVACCTSMNLWAQQAQCISTPGTAYYFGNGVLNTFIEATVSTQAMVRELDADGILQPADSYALAYNRNDGLYIDLVESLVQDLQTSVTQVLNFLTSGLPDDVQDQVVSTAARFNQTLLGSEDVDRHIKQYKSAMLSGNKVVTLAHSQGNFFATLAWQLLDSDEQLSMGVVSVANPDSGAAEDSCAEVSVNIGGGPLVEILSCAASLPTPSFLECRPDLPRYTTACTDLVTVGLRELYGSIDGSQLFDYLPRALPPNTEAAIGSDWSGHQFVQTYLHPTSSTRTQIVADVRTVKNSLATPTIIGDLSIVGTVTSEVDGSAIIGARAKVELVESALYDAVVDDFTDAAGFYSLCVPSDFIPDNFLLIASKDGYIPEVKNVTKDGSGFQSVDFSLSQHAENVVVIEVDPVVHHLGNDNFSGQINSQFQKNSEGIELISAFNMNAAQRAATSAELSLVAKGLQADNPILFNDQEIGFLAESPTDGSFGLLKFDVPIEFLQGEIDVATITVRSVQAGGFLGLDYDDFEFANVILTLTLQ